MRAQFLPVPVLPPCCLMTYGHAAGAGHRGHLFQVADKCFVFARGCFPKSQQVGHSGCCGLFDAAHVGGAGAGRLQLDIGEHHDGLQSHAPAALGQRLGLGRRRIHGQRRTAVPRPFHVHGSPDHIVVTGSLNRFERALHRKLLKWQCHAGKLEVREFRSVGADRCRR